VEKGLEYYMNLPYTIELVRDPGDPWFIRVKELPGCMSHGDTPEEAVAMIREAMELWLEGALEHGDLIPEPEPPDDYSGKFVVRMPRSLHRKLAEQADRDEVSLNTFVTAALAEAVGYRAALTQGATYTMPIKAPEAQPAVAESGPTYETQAGRKRKAAKQPRSGK
jgi:predicted RNase H-like HicB family nuclease